MTKVIFKENDRVKLFSSKISGTISKIVDDKMHILWDDEFFDDELEDFDIQQHNNRRTIYNADGFEASLARRLVYHENEEEPTDLHVWIHPDLVNKVTYLLIKFPEGSTDIQVSTNCIGFKNASNFNYISKDINDFYHAFIMLGIGRLIKEESSIDDFINSVTTSKDIDFDF
jgi:hypothetical protein